jgi:hypothetical protein
MQMADAQPNARGIDEEERVLVAALKAVKERKARILEEAEVKRKAEEKRKADEAEAQWVEEARKAKKAEQAWEAEAAAEKECAAEALKIRAANEALQVSIEHHVTHKQRVEEAAQAEAFAFEMHRRKLAVLGAMSDDPLMQATEGPGPSRQELQEVQREFSGKPKKRKVRETENTVSFPNFGPRTH